jgi:phosphatidate cytidylyltransferase
MSMAGGKASEKPSRAGRNLPAAIASSLILGAVVLVSLFTVKWLFCVVVTVALLIAVHEFVSAFAQRDIRIARTPLYVATAVMPALAYIWGTTALLVALGASIIIILIWRIRRGTDYYVRDVTASAFVVAYLPFMAGWLLRFLRHSRPQEVVRIATALRSLLASAPPDRGGVRTAIDVDPQSFL